MKTALEMSWLVCCVLFAIYLICKIVSLCLNDWMLHQFEIVPETKRVPVSPDGWCEGFAGVWDGFFDQRERKYLTFQPHEN